MNLRMALVLIPFVVVGCGPGKSSKSSDEVDPIYLEAHETLNTYTKGLTLDPATPEGVGTLLALNEGLMSQKNIGLCTWFLIGKSRALTNSHCVPEALKKEKTLSCGDYLQGGFQTKSGVRKVRCKKLVHAASISQNILTNSDYALIELEEAVDGVAVFKLDRRGILENEKLKLLTMNHQYLGENRIYGEFMEQQCLVKSSDTYRKLQSPGTSPVMAFKEEGSRDHCKALQGNSGSPVIDGSGRLVGILHGGVKEGKLDLPANVTSKVTSEVSIITNLRCQKFLESELDADYPEECKEERKEEKIDLERVNAELSAKGEKLLAEAVAKEPAFIEYNFVTQATGSGSLVTLTPKCIVPLKEWRPADLREIEAEGVFVKKKKIRAKIPQYSLELMMGLDYYGNWKWDVTLKTTVRHEYEFRGLEALEKKGFVTASVDLKPLGKIERTILTCKKP